MLRGDLSLLISAPSAPFKTRNLPARRRSLAVDPTRVGQFLAVSHGCGASNGDWTRSYHLSVIVAVAIAVVGVLYWLNFRDYAALGFIGMRCAVCLRLSDRSSNAALIQSEGATLVGGVDIFARSWRDLPERALRRTIACPRSKADNPFDSRRPFQLRSKAIPLIAGGGALPDAAHPDLWSGMNGALRCGFVNRSRKRLWAPFSAA